MADSPSAYVDLLGVVIAFSAVMLLLSILVTSLAQATQAVLRLRARNLERGLATILEGELPAGKKERGKEISAALLNSPEILPIGRRKHPTSIRSRILGPVVSWVEPETLGEALAGKGSEAPLTPEKRQTIVERFRQSDPLLKKRFGAIMRAISLLWALAIAGLFQVSTPRLLEDLSFSDYRARVLGMTPATLSAGGAALRRLEDASRVSENALGELRANHPDLQEELARIVVQDGAPEGVSEDLAEELEGVSGRAEIVSEYEGLFVEGLEEWKNQALREADSAASLLSRIDIRPWRYGPGFYYLPGDIKTVNILGVLATAILLSLGAPFWFYILSGAIAFRDVLAPPEDKEKKSKPGPGHSPDSAGSGGSASTREGPPPSMPQEEEKP